MRGVYAECLDRGDIGRDLQRLVGKWFLREKELGLIFFGLVYALKDKNMLFAWLKAHVTIWTLDWIKIDLYLN